MTDQAMTPDRAAEMDKDVMEVLRLAIDLIPDAEAAPFEDARQKLAELIAAASNEQTTRLRMSAAKLEHDRYGLPAYVYTAVCENHVRSQARLAAALAACRGL